MNRQRENVHLASDTNRWGACGHARNQEQTTDPAKVTCGHCRKQFSARRNNQVAWEASAAAEFLDSYSDDSDLYRAFPMVVGLMRVYAARLRAALSDEDPDAANSDIGPLTDGAP